MLRKAVFCCLKPCILNATSNVPSPSKCTKIVGGQTPLWELTTLPRPPSWINGATSKGGEKEEMGMEGNRKKGEVTGGEGRDFGPSQRWKQIDAPALRT